MTTRRSFIALLGAAALVTACPSTPTTPDGGGSNGFITTAGNILTHLDNVLTGMGPHDGALGTAISVAHAAVGVALSALSLFRDGESSCRDIGSVVSNAIRSVLSVLDALRAALLAIPSILVIAAAGAATIVDQVVSLICGPAVDAGPTRGIDAVLTTSALQAQFAARSLSYPAVPATLVAPPVR